MYQVPPRLNGRFPLQLVHATERADCRLGAVHLVEMQLSLQLDNPQLASGALGAVDLDGHTPAAGEAPLHVGVRGRCFVGCA
eukprot:CAMPEP_0181358108 /NCGR_PEP_ID=MMETSP1106-20121128/5329_1 /TAXON_ID=81844 /ORGANISM="Mantoniella antarctica, Strain SL-175" /LENGTH=81 /DNA_ID=CAMNT_0023471037 /DNA_START=636 /DNA_END=878 /DNA_ORIENTATION=+